MSSDLERARQLFTDGLARHVEKDWAAAERLYRQALQLVPDRPSIVFNLGRLMLDQERNPEAEALFRRSLEFVPDPEASYNLALSLLRQGRFEEALRHYDEAIALQPDRAEAHAGRGWALENLGRVAEGLASHARSVELAPDCADFQVGFCRCARLAGGGAPLGAPALLETAALTCLKERNVDYQDLKALSLALLEWRFAGFAISLEAGAFDWAKTAAAQARELRAYCGDWLLLGALEKIALTDYSNEGFFTRLRASLLKFTVIGSQSPALVELLAPLALFLAQQCFLNEYVWDVGDTEAALMEKLEARVAGAIVARTVASMELAILGCYVPLYKVEGVAAWSEVAVENAEPALLRLLNMQVREPLREAQIAASLTQVGAIENPTSLAVRAQYEQNPYPRWLALPKSRPIPYIGQIARDITPHVPLLGPAIDHPRILIAGCGTGRHALSYGASFLGAHVLGIDLSSASLAYATRKALESGAGNVEFARGDILALDALEATFDVVSSVGVLHHMSEPERGLQSLLRRLKPDGYLMLGLYSELARQDIVRVRAHIAARGFAPTPSGIRACRAYLRHYPGDEFRALMTEAADFYSMSMVRDLLFHVQEHRFTMPQVDDLLARNGLEFLGFANARPAKALYARTYPDDPDMLDFGNWDALEAQHPQLFREMYQFWVRRVSRARP